MIDYDTVPAIEVLFPALIFSSIYIPVQTVEKNGKRIEKRRSEYIIETLFEDDITWSANRYPGNRCIQFREVFYEIHLF